MIRPLNKRIIAKLAPTEEVIKGTLILTPKEPRKDIYTVISVAENEQGIKVGDRILMDKYDALEKEIDGEAFYILQCDRVLGVIE